jgi:hypothetical protein
MKKTLIGGTCLLNLLLFGCTVIYTANPVSIQKMDSKEICIIENTDMNARFLPAYEKALEKKGFLVNILSPGSYPAACPLSSTYLTEWSWDFVPYMSHAQIFIYRNGIMVGNALYNAPCCGWSLTFKIYEKTDNKLLKMVNQLFPDTESK